jgi:hypothetical protein
MTPALDVAALKSKSQAAAAQRNKFLNFVSECTPVTAFMLYALNALERATADIGMPGEFEGKIFIHEPDNRFQGADHKGEAIYCFAKRDGRWGLVSVSALVKAPFRVSIIEDVLSKLLGVDPTSAGSEIMRVLRETTEGDCSEMLAIFDLMPVNSVVPLLFNREVFAKLLGVTNLDGYARAVTQWYCDLGVASEQLPIGVKDLHDWMTSVDVFREKYKDVGRVWYYIRHNTEFDVERQILQSRDLHIVRHAISSGLVPLEHFQKCSRDLAAKRSPDFVKMLIDVGLRFSAADLDNVLLHACFRSGRDDDRSAEILQLLFDVGVSFLGRNSYLNSNNEYHVSPEIKALVQRLRKQEREKIAEVA